MQLNLSSILTGIGIPPPLPPSPSRFLPKRYEPAGQNCQQAPPVTNKRKDHSQDIHLYSLSVSLSLSLSVSVSVCLCLCVSVCLFVRPSVCLSVSLSLSLSLSWQFSCIKLYSLIHADMYINDACTFILYIDRFYIALFSALEQTHCIRM